MTVRIYALDKFKNFSMCSLGGMTDPVVGVYFEADSLDCYSVSSGGQLAVWESSLDLAQLEPGLPVRKEKKKKEVDQEKEEEDMEDEEGGQVETLETTDKSSQSARLIYKRNSRHFLRQVHSVNFRQG